MQLQPRFPAPLTIPLRMIPAFVHNKALVVTLNQIFQQELKNGDLNFLQDKIIHITVKDMGIEYRLTLDQGQLVTIDKGQSADLVLRGNMYDYLLLASRSEDTDTLFFSRRLQMQGNTELGLYLKNFLDGLDMDSHKVAAFFESALQKSLPLYERIFK